jgi:hypothetical protein
MQDSVQDALARTSHGDLTPSVAEWLQVCRRRFVDEGCHRTSHSIALREAEVALSTQFPEGTSIVIDLATFEIVHAAKRTSALKAFIARFGKSASGWSFDVGRPLMVGGGACPS